MKEWWTVYSMLIESLSASASSTFTGNFSIFNWKLVIVSELFTSYDSREREREREEEGREGEREEGGGERQFEAAS